MPRYLISFDGHAMNHIPRRGHARRHGQQRAALAAASLFG